MNRILTAVAVCVAVSILPAFAADVSFGGKTLFSIKAQCGGKTPDQRVNDVEARLIDVLGETSIKDKDVIVKKDKLATKIYVKNHYLVDVTAEDAKANKTTVEKLARTWRAAIAKQLPSMHLLPEQVGPTKAPRNWKKK